MVFQSRSVVGHIIWAIAYFLISFIVTRGKDGSLMGAIVLVPIVSVAHAVWCQSGQGVGITSIIALMVAIIVITFCGTMIQSELDGMGGMLVLIVPIVASATWLLAIGVAAILKRER